MGILVFLISFAGQMDSVGAIHELPLHVDSINTPTRYEDKWVSSDKLHHFAYSFGITGLAYHVYHCKLNNPNPGARYFSISLAGTIGIGKEIYDKVSKKGEFSYKDILTDAVGITVATLLFTR